MEHALALLPQNMLVMFEYLSTEQSNPSTSWRELLLSLKSSVGKIKFLKIAFESFNLVISVVRIKIFQGFPNELHRNIPIPRWQFFAGF